MREDFNWKKNSVYLTVLLALCALYFVYYKPLRDFSHPLMYSMQQSVTEDAW